MALKTRGMLKTCNTLGAYACISYLYDSWFIFGSCWLGLWLSCSASLSFWSSLKAMMSPSFLQHLNCKLTHLWMLTLSSQLCRQCFTLCDNLWLFLIPSSELVHYLEWSNLDQACCSKGFIHKGLAWAGYFGKADTRQDPWTGRACKNDCYCRWS